MFDQCEDPKIEHCGLWSRIQSSDHRVWWQQTKQSPCGQRIPGCKGFWFCRPTATFWASCPDYRSPRSFRRAWMQQSRHCPCGPPVSPARCRWQHPKFWPFYPSYRQRQVDYLETQRCWSLQGHSDPPRWYAACANIWRLSNPRFWLYDHLSQRREHGHHDWIRVSKCPARGLTRHIGCGSLQFPKSRSNKWVCQAQALCLIRITHSDASVFCARG